MFKNLSNFSMKRNWKEAIIFYLAYLILGLLIGALVGGIVGAINPTNVFEISVRAGSVAGTIYCLILYFAIYIKKGLSSFLYIIIGVIAGVINIFTGNLFSLIIVAFLTTRENKLESDVDMSNS